MIATVGRGVGNDEIEPSIGSAKLGRAVGSEEIWLDVGCDAMGRDVGVEVGIGLKFNKRTHCKNERRRNQIMIR